MKTSVWLYGQKMTVYYQSITVYWDSPDELVLFVLTQLPSSKQMILLSSDVNLTAQEVIEAYGWRFKIEVSFRTLAQGLGGFSYQFWLKAMTRISRWPENLCLADYEQKVQAQITTKVEAFERFVNLNAMALGLLQILALEFPAHVWLQFPRWFRTFPKQGYPSEQIVRRVLQHQQSVIFSKSSPTLLLPKLLTDKIKTFEPLEPPELVT